MKKRDESIICAGFGGQGIMLLGKVLAHAGMLEGYNVTWLPAYGAEVRGGTAYSMVKISDSPIASPLVKLADTGIIMNGPSLDKFEMSINSGGLLLLNSSIVERDTKRTDVCSLKVPLTDEAIKVGNARVANIIAAAIISAVKGTFSREALVKVIEMLGAGYEDLIKINLAAVEKGIEIGNKLAGQYKSSGGMICQEKRSGKILKESV